MKLKKKRYADYSDVDAKSLFIAEGIPFKEGGKNVSAGWVGVCCPFCGEQNFHLGVNLETKRYSCWVCTETGTLLKLVSVILGIPYSKAHDVLKPFRGHRYEAPIRELAPEIIYPTNVRALSSKGHEYLRKRGFDSEELEKKYHLQETNVLSELRLPDHTQPFKCRIIIPIIMDREIVSYTGRDWTGKQDPRYQNAPLEASTLHTSECLYNLDTVRDRALIVEGPADVWKLGDETIGTLGVKFSHGQINRIIQKNLKRAVILFDDGAEAAAKSLYYTLAPFITDLKVYTTIDIDPGEMNPIEAKKLKYDLLYGE